MNRTDRTDRTFIKMMDRKRGILEYLNKNKFLNRLLIVITNGFFYVSRRIFASNKKTNNVIIINLNRIGDTVFTIPAIDVILKHFSRGYKVTIIAYPESKDILKLKYNLDMIVSIDKDNFLFNRRIANKKARVVLKKLKPEIIFDLTGSIITASLLFSSKAGKIYGSSQIYYKNIYTKYLSLRTEPHLIDRYLDVANLYIKFQRDKSLYEHKININPTGEIIIHPFAIRKAKEWNFEKYCKLAETLSIEFKIKMIIPEGYLEPVNLQGFEKLKIPFIITHDIASLIESIRGASLFISNDSGPLYIANLLGVPTYTIYGPTNPDYSFPFGEYHRYIRKIIECSPINSQYCFTQGGIHCPNYLCMHLLSLEEVLAGVKNFITFIKANRRP
jgi:ADP-heptose:LPS heptosyltransferase